MKNLFKRKRFRLIFFFLLAAAVTFALTKILPSFPEFVEKYYSRGLYKYVSQPISLFFGIFPFSMAEILIISAIIFSFIYLIVCIVKSVKNIRRKTSSPWKPLLGFITYAVCLASALYSCFYVFWGFNFSRKPLSENLGYEVTDAPVSELEDLCRELATEINRLRPLVDENDDGVMTVYPDLQKRAVKGFDNLSKNISYMGGSYCRPQYLLTSTGFCYMNITGIFIPYTFEANVNSRTPECSLPATILHEMAHQRGFCREDEANYVAFLACRAHPDLDYQYSGYYLAFVYSINALSSYDSDAASAVYSMIDQGYRRDASAAWEFWKQFEGPVEEVASSVNDTYLQSNGQEDGVHSYGRIVDLLLAERRSRI